MLLDLLSCGVLLRTVSATMGLFLFEFAPKRMVLSLTILVLVHVISLLGNVAVTFSHCILLVH